MGLVPNLFESVGDSGQGPNELEPVVNRVHAIGESAEYNELVTNDPPSPVSAAQRVRETQGDSAACT